VVKTNESRPKTMVEETRTIVVGGVRNGIGASSPTIVDSTCPVTTNGNVEDDYRTP